MYFGIEPQEELGHRGIAGDDEMGDQGSIDLAHLEQFLDDSVDGGDDDLL